MSKREAKRREMAKLMTRWEARGKSGAAFAREAGMPESRLWYWRRRIGRGRFDRIGLFGRLGLADLAVELLVGSVSWSGVSCLVYLPRRRRLRTSSR